MRGNSQGLGYMIGGLTDLQKLLEPEDISRSSYKILEHYANKFTKTFRPTNVLHLFTSF